MLPLICATAADLAGKERRLPTRSRSEEKTTAAATPQGLCPVTPRATAAEGRGGGAAVGGGWELPGAGRRRGWSRVGGGEHSGLFQVWSLTVDRIPDAELGNVGDMGIHYTSGSTSQAGATTKMGRQLPSPRFTMYDSAMIRSNKSVMEFPSDGLPNEHWPRLVKGNWGGFERKIPERISDNISTVSYPEKVQMTADGKLLEGCSDDQRMRILCEVTKAHGELIAVSCSMHGTRAVQKIIETVNNPDQVSKIVSALNPGAMHLVLDPNGSHVANRCLQKLLPKSKAFLPDTCTLHYLGLATHQQGCCSIQKCIEHSDDEQKFNMLSNIISNALTLADVQFGYGS
ncbi:Pumilio-like protein 12 [Hordeum vulgare]|nr:Pumilio-like protein 12 [Hordeum vulgare]